ncbi:MAG: CPBP family intramembrane metalloprotease [Polyangiaceae bacterium]|nr:CPBP family intramembrane metalloprotease [Polyangiaceae bacterium]
MDRQRPRAEPLPTRPPGGVAPGTTAPAADGAAEPDVPAESSQGWLARTLARSKTDPLTDLLLTVPVFLVYHVGVVTLGVRNAADPLTAELVKLARHNTWLYWTLTLGIGVVLASVLLALHRKERFESWRFGMVAVEGVVYAVLMRFGAGWVVGALPLGPPGVLGRWDGFVVSLGAGFYEELLWRVGLFGVGALVLRWLVKEPGKRVTYTLVWALAAAAAFSGWHHLGELGDPWNARVFAFRTVCGTFFTAVFALRGFATVVWTHALYDVWVLVL